VKDWPALERAVDEKIDWSRQPKWAAPIEVAIETPTPPPEKKPAEQPLALRSANKRLNWMPVIPRRNWVTSWR
jgi:hypothetical protein